MRLSRSISLLLSLMFVALVSVGVASAAPTKSPNAETFDLTCNNGKAYTIVVNGNGDYTPAHIINDDGGTLIPIAFVFEGTAADGTVIFTEMISKKGQRKGLANDLITCTFGGIFEDNGETFTFTGTVTGFATPRN